MILAHKILRSLANASDVAGRGIRVAASIGIALYHPDFLSPEHYLNLACCAMDVAKEERRNTDRLIRKRSTSFSKVKSRSEPICITRWKTKISTIYFQPQIDLRTNQAVGLEALARWSHRRRGAVEPTKFIGVAERKDQIVIAAGWVLRQACLQARVWLDQGLMPDVMAINLSPLQFKDQQLVADVRARLARAGCRRSGSNSKLRRASLWNRWAVTMRRWRGCGRTAFGSP